MASSFCLELFHYGNCMHIDCSGKHDVRVCVPCGKTLADTAEYARHLEKTEHRKNVDAFAHGPAPPLQCFACKQTVRCDRDWDVHAASHCHTKSGGDYAWPVEKGVKDSYRCTDCRITMPQWAIVDHLKEDAHIIRERAARHFASIGKEERMLGGVTVSHLEGLTYRGGLAEVRSPTTRRFVPLEVLNTSREVVTIQAVQVDNVLAKAPSFELVVDPTGRILAPSTGCIILVERPQKAGSYEDCLRFVVKCGDQPSYLIARKLQAVIQNGGSRKLLTRLSKSKLARNKKPKSLGRGKTFAARSVVVHKELKVNTQALRALRKARMFALVRGATIGRRTTRSKTLKQQIFLLG